MNNEQKVEEVLDLLETSEEIKNRIRVLILGEKPELTISGIKVDGLYPASQIHLRIDRRITEEEQEKIIEALKIPFCGMVNIAFCFSRIIITTSFGATERKYWAERFCEAISKALDLT